MLSTQDLNFTCPISQDPAQRISISHGGGGKLMHNLIKQYIQPLYTREIFSHQDSAVLDIEGSRIAFATDSFVVDPLFFPGGDIGKLAICGTINDLAMSGAIPRYISLAFIIEEGFSTESFKNVLSSIARTAKESNVEIVTGDTKVVERSKGDKIYVNTSGIGYVKDHLNIGPDKVKSGDAIIISGDIGRHGVSVMSSRDGTAADVGVESDCAPLDSIVQRLLEHGLDIHCLRDLTRGGLASALNEISEVADLSATLDESRIPIDRRVASYCEILGIEPYYLANEGRFVCILPAKEAKRALELFDSGAEIIGFFDTSDKGLVKMQSDWGTERILPMLSGEQLPRIC